MKHYQPVEAFAWGQNKYDKGRLVPESDPVVRRFPQLFIDPDTGKAIELEPEPPKRKPGRPRKQAAPAGTDDGQ